MNQPYQPEKWVMLKDHIYAAQKAIRIAIELTQDKMQQLEIADTMDRQSKAYYEILRQENKQCEVALKNLLNPAEEKEGE